MSRATRLTLYIQMIEDFLGRRTPANYFAGAFFRAFKDDNSKWGGEIYDSLNAVALAAEGYEPGRPYSRFDVTEEQLRAECSRRLPILRDQASAI